MSLKASDARISLSNLVCLPVEGAFFSYSFMVLASEECYTACSTGALST